MKTKFKFDKKTGTVVAVESMVPVPDNDNPVAPIEPPVFKEEKKIETTSTERSKEVVKMKRVNTQTPILLIDDNGAPDSYIDAVNTGVMMFREKQDYDICQITDVRTGKPLAMIGGYALQISFNMSELRSMEKIEACLQGLTKLFRQKIMSQTFNHKKE